MSNFKIKKSVGNMMDNDEADVLSVKKQLYDLGHRKNPPQNGIIEQETDDAIRRFQKEKGLKVDGFLMPGGETEKALRDVKLNYQKEIEKKGFKENGLALSEAIISEPADALKAWIIERKVNQDIGELYSDRPLRGNNDIDAFRHALWSYRMTKSFGAEKAKMFSDAYERRGLERGQPEGETVMDIHNNLIGIKLALDNKNSGMDDVKVIQKAMDSYSLYLQPPKLSPRNNIHDRMFTNRNMTATGAAYSGNK